MNASRGVYSVVIIDHLKFVGEARQQTGQGTDKAS